MSCLCNQTFNIEVTTQLSTLQAQLDNLQACLSAVADRIAAIDGRVGDWVPDDASQEYDDDDSLEYGTDDDDIVAGPEPESDKDFDGLSL